MHTELLPDATAAAQRAAAFIAEQAREAVRERGRFLLALSGGETPRPMLAALARQPLPWERVQLFQVDERAAPRGGEARNLTHLERLLVAPAGLSPGCVHAMPVEAADLAAGAAAYAETLVAAAGAPPVLDLVHLGLGTDGHAASLFAGDAALEVDDAWVAATGLHRGHRRLTLTLPTLDRARCLLWLVCGADKAGVLARLLDGDDAMPAGRVPRARAWIVADEAAGRPHVSASRGPS
ncbi:MAG: 6-phosphogluconolactonase [Burkholderiales bacterium]|nr:6-phosphogluconolactonase [Burkholderiales bacterium]OJX05787.1 MAG: 6-phosphogluconolactonase [Burkholderiales bacterium 70-64]